jgi:hypothetical protein
MVFVNLCPDKLQRQKKESEKGADIPIFDFLQQVQQKSHKKIEKRKFSDA